VGLYSQSKAETIGLNGQKIYGPGHLAYLDYATQKTSFARVIAFRSSEAWPELTYCNDSSGKLIRVKSGLVLKVIEDSDRVIADDITDAGAISGFEKQYRTLKEWSAISRKSLSIVQNDMQRFQDANKKLQKGMVRVSGEWLLPEEYASLKAEKQRAIRTAEIDRVTAQQRAQEMRLSNLKAEYRSKLPAISALVETVRGREVTLARTTEELKTFLRRLELFSEFEDEAN